MNIHDEQRPMNEDERARFDVLLDAQFPGREQVWLQLENCEVRVLDEFGCLQLFPKRRSPANVARPIPVEAEGLDVDGVRIHYLLHAEGGIVNLLEVFKEDGSHIKTHPPAMALTVRTWD